MRCFPHRGSCPDARSRGGQGPKQIVIETPTGTNPSSRSAIIHAGGQSTTVVAGLGFLRYDGQGIKGSSEEIRGAMESVTFEASEGVETRWADK